MNVAAQAQILDDAFSAVNEWFRADRPKVSSPTQDGRWIETWEIEVLLERDGELMSISLLAKLPRDFPLSFPRVYLTPESHSLLGHPLHVDDNHFVCTVDTTQAQIELDKAYLLPRDMIRHAAAILESGLNTTPGDYNDELYAYWGQSFCPPCKESVDTSWLSVIEDFGSITRLRLKSKLGKVSNIILCGGTDGQILQANLARLGFEYDIQPVYVVDIHKSLAPPYRLTFRDILAHIEEAEEAKSLKRQINSEPGVDVAFIIRDDAEDIPFRRGYLIKYRDLKMKGFRPGSLTPFRELSMFLGAQEAKRFRADQFTWNRMKSRSTGEGVEERRPHILYVGLGSIGSHLAEMIGWNYPSTLGLVDPDILSVDNVGRHVLGLDSVGFNKAKRMEEHALRSNPLLAINVVSDRTLGDQSIETPDLLSDFDLNVISIADFATETWVSRLLKTGEISTPSLFIWVEPYLAAGHAVLIHPNTVSLEEYFSDGHYDWDLISQTQNTQSSLFLRERGCQSSYLPYGSRDTSLFIASLWNWVSQFFITPDNKSKRFRWFGNLEQIRLLGISLSTTADTALPFTWVAEDLT